MGQKYGQLTVIGFDQNRHKQKRAICRCACGKIHKATAYKLVSRHTQSCGCLRKQTEYQYGTGKRVLSNVRATYRGSAKQKGLEFKLTNAEIDKLVTSPCLYCGMIPYRVWRVCCGEGRVDQKTCNGIDRVNSAKGYLKENCVSCCPRCNYAKRDMPVVDFVDWALNLADNLRRTNLRDSLTAENTQVP